MRRPVVLTLVAWLFIAVGAAGLGNDLWPLLTSHAAEQIARLRADGLADIGPAWTARVAAVVAGIWLLRGRNWARWVLVAWMAFHIGLSAFHSRRQLIAHCVFFPPILYVLFRRESNLYLRTPIQPQRQV